jgi:hypothetical protein
MLFILFRPEPRADRRATSARFKRMDEQTVRRRFINALGVEAPAAVVSSLLALYVRPQFSRGAHAHAHAHAHAYAHGGPGTAPKYITSIPPLGIVINQPGTYRLCGSAAVKWRAQNRTTVAITVAADDVTLDFAGATLLCVSGGVAVVVDAARAARVTGGTVEGCTLFGIVVKGSRDATVEGMTVRATSNDDPSLLSASIHVVDSPGATVANCVVSGVRATGTTVAGVAVVASDDSTVKNCRVLCLANRAGACVGILAALCVGTAVRGCRVSDLHTEPGENLHAEGHTCAGILPTVSLGVALADNAVLRIAGSCDDAHGISVFLCAAVTVARCQVRSVSTGGWGARASAKSTGIEVYGLDCEVTDCTAKHISAKCPGDRQCTGFSVAWAENVVFRNCRAEDVVVKNLAGHASAKLYGYGAGFGWAPDPRPVFRQPARAVRYEQCVAKDCQVGFDTWFHIDSLWERPKYVGSGLPVWNNDARRRRLTCVLCSECPVPIDVCVDNVAHGNVVAHPEIHCRISVPSPLPPGRPP